VGLGEVTLVRKFALLWLAGMTIVAIVLTAWRAGLGRLGGMMLFVLYAVFVTLLFAWR
jgi:hypothetical protein